ncbi:MAG TPA: ECF-type sigma factor [Lysobacter sp.]
MEEAPARGSDTGLPAPPFAGTLEGLLRDARSGEPMALGRAYAVIYDELRRHARRHLGSRNSTLTPTVLVNEVYLKLSNADIDPRDRNHLFALSARAMRHIVIDYARRAGTDKRGAQMMQVTLTENLLDPRPEAAAVIALDGALRKLADVDARLAQVVEWRYFGGYSEAQVAESLGVTVRTVQRDWRKARAFLGAALSAGDNAADAAGQ